MKNYLARDIYPSRNNDRSSSSSYYKIRNNTLFPKRERERSSNLGTVVAHRENFRRREEDNKVVFFFYFIFFPLFPTPRKGLTNDACEFFISRNKTEPLRAFLFVGEGRGKRARMMRQKAENVFQHSRLRLKLGDARTRLFLWRDASLFLSLSFSSGSSLFNGEKRKTEKSLGQIG